VALRLFTRRLRLGAQAALLLAFVAMGALVPLMWQLVPFAYQWLAWSFALVALALGLWSIRSIDRRLDALIVSAESLEAGRVPVGSTASGIRDPIGDLSKAIHRMADRVNEQVNHDVTTGLPNRRFFDELLGPAVDAARAQGHQLGVVLLDLDLFKDVNDSFGHEMGDAMLRQVGARLRNTVRECDVVARLGGDEFGVIIGRAESSDAVKGLAGRVVAAFEDPFRLEDHELKMTGSVGVSLFPDHGDGPLELMRNADAALYRAKDAGRNRLYVFDEGMSEWAQLRLELGEELRSAIARSEVDLHYQPVVSLRNGEIVGIESLARWIHPLRGSLAPDTFIPIAEETGLIPSLGAALLEKACLQNARWHRQGVARLPISVNVSVRQLQAGNLVGLVKNALRSSALPAKYLRLELSDNHAVRHMEKVLQCVSTLGRTGVEFAMDDFGTGYSSMRHLLRYPLCTLKIDSSLIAGVPHDEDSVTIVEAAIGLGRGLGLEVIAEGVENDAQLAFLRLSGCDAAQGFLLCRPLPAERFTFLLKRGYIPLEDSERQSLLA
jgi:diguanylate cyclase (GGDEF)-like protein